MIREIKRQDIPECVSVIKTGFMTVADEFGFTEENAPRFTAFATDEQRLNWQFDEGRPMFVYVGNDDSIVGYVSLHITDNGECELNNLCVLPEHRHKLIGNMLYDHAVKAARQHGCKVMNIGIVEENVRLRRWYEKLGARHIGTEKFDFFPFTCGYMTADLSIKPMKHKRLDRDLWGFQHFPYYQMRIDCDIYHGFASVIRLIDGEPQYWSSPIAGKYPICGGGMLWLQLIPDNQNRLITASYLPEPKTIDGKEYPYSATSWYADVTEGWSYGADGVAVYVDKYLDVIFTPQGDVIRDDRDELDAAYEGGIITKAQYDSAISECESIINELCTDIDGTERWCAEILMLALQKIEQDDVTLKKGRGITE
ncbi:MAG: GNAT family N-acetyltransferase [Eubacterium sp.]|nr:GNAT family N-acetyltransferase [Eubacterium sp.]